MIGSYIGLLFLVFSYVAIGIFASTLSKNQVVAFIVSVFLCFFMYYGFEGLSSLLSSSSHIINSLGMKEHFNSVSRGVIDTRDIIYFSSISILFITLTIYNIEKD